MGKESWNPGAISGKLIARNTESNNTRILGDTYAWFSRWMPNYISAGISNGIPSAILKQISGGLLEKTPVQISEGISEKLTEETTKKIS